jgi:DNA repair ATPase RecN
MKQFGNVNAVIAQLQSLAARSDVGPDQKKYVEKAIKALRRFRRRAHPTQEEVFACVREVAEEILNACVK